MKITITRVYNLFGEVVKSEDPEDVTVISCERVELHKNKLFLFNGENLIGELKLDFINYAYDFTGE